MRTIKIVLGIIIGIAALYTMLEMAGEEKGAGLAGAATGFFVLGALAIWLIYSGTKGNKE